ncbi:RhuM family protein [Mannheimia haemolytica]
MSQYFRPLTSAKFRQIPIIFLFLSFNGSIQSVIRNFLITAADGKNYRTKHYNLDAVISIGYRVNSVRATQFRQWATKVLRDFAQKGYVIDRQRMENGTFLNEDYFEQLLAEIREIWLSERRS